MTIELRRQFAEVENPAERVYKRLDGEARVSWPLPIELVVVQPVARLPKPAMASHCR